MWEWIQDNFWIWTLVMVVMLGGLIAVLLMVRKNQED